MSSRWNSDEEAAAYLAGMIDGEGTVIHGPPPGNARTVRVYNKNNELINATADACDRLRITYKIGWWDDSRNSSWCHSLRIYSKENFVRIRAVVPLQATSKVEKLDGIIASYTRK